MEENQRCAKCGAIIETCVKCEKTFCPECDKGSFIDVDTSSYCSDCVENAFREAGFYVCKHCGREYDIEDSDAEKSKIFCSLACEYGY